MLLSIGMFVGVKMCARHFWRRLCSIKNATPHLRCLFRANNGSLLFLTIANIVFSAYENNISRNETAVIVGGPTRRPRVSPVFAERNQIKVSNMAATRLLYTEDVTSLKSGSIRGTTGKYRGVARGGGGVGGVSTPPPARGWVKILALFRGSLRPSEGGKCQNFRAWRRIFSKKKKKNFCLDGARAKNSQFFTALSQKTTRFIRFL